MKILPVILAGGTGSRLWPLSRELYPKQIINLTGKQSLLQITLSRLAASANIMAPYIVVGEAHRYMVKSHVDELGLFRDYKILLEANGRNTAPAICGAALYAKEHGLEDTVLLVLPADHLISDTGRFHECVRKAFESASGGNLVTFGITPERPETGYGYIKKGDDNRLEKFVEKPDLETAKKYIQRGDYFWNSGMFAFQAKKLLAEMEEHAPDILSKMKRAVEMGQEDGAFFRFEETFMDACVSESIDYAVMEKTRDGAIVEADFDWNDIGSWQSLWEASGKDESGNTTCGDVILEDTNDSYIRAEQRLVAAVGLENMMVVETGDAVMVAPLDRSQDVKKIVTRLKAEKRDETLTHQTVHRPWGCYTTLELYPRFQIKRITVKPGAKLSLQMHYHRNEHWVVVSGTANIVNGDDLITLKENESTYIEAGKQHRLENPGIIPLELIEVQIGSYLGEDDIVRFEDIYGRKN